MRHESSAKTTAEPFPLNGNGIPTSREAYLLVSAFFAERASWHRVDELAQRIGVALPCVQSMCRDLELADILTADEARFGVYRYNLSCSRVQLQAGLEASLIDPPAVISQRRQPCS